MTRLQHTQWTLQIVTSPTYIQCIYIVYRSVVVPNRNGRKSCHPTKTMGEPVGATALRQRFLWRAAMQAHRDSPALSRVLLLGLDALVPADEPLPAYLKLAPSHCGSSVQSRAQIRRFCSAVACAVLQTLVDDSLQKPSTSMVTSEPIRWFDVL